MSKCFPVAPAAQSVSCFPKSHLLVRGHIVRLRFQPSLKLGLATRVSFGHWEVGEHVIEQSWTIKVSKNNGLCSFPFCQPHAEKGRAIEWKEARSPDYCPEENCWPDRDTRSVPCQWDIKTSIILCSLLHGSARCGPNQIGHLF